MLSDYFAGQEKVVKDSVHGYIRIPACYMHEIVDTDLFQRLRHVEQTSMRSLFPSARHDRFIHSLGVFHLGCRAFDAIRNNAGAEGLSTAIASEIPECDEAWWAKQFVLFTIACLLHDCAHAAFSHTYEAYYELPKSELGTDGILPERRDGGEPILPRTMSKLDAELLREYRCDPEFAWDLFGDGPSACGAPHERMSALMVKRYFGEAIGRIFEELNAAGHVDAQLYDADLALVARMIIGCKYLHAYSSVHELQNCFIELLNSSTVDVDGLDYMMRDTYNSGLSNRTVDCDRLLDSLRIRSATRCVGAHVSCLSATGVWLGGSSILLDKHHDAQAEVEVCGQVNVRFDSSEDYDRIKNQYGSLALARNTLSSSDDGQIFVLQKLRSSCCIQTVKPCRASLQSWSGELDGLFCGDAFDRESLDAGSAERSFVLSYGKASVSVLQAAVDARNTFYQWVYAHPQVVYHSNFLQNYLLKMSAKYLCCLDAEEKAPDELSDGLPPRSCLDGCIASKRASSGASPSVSAPAGEEEMIETILGMNGFFEPHADYSRANVWRDFAFWRSSDDDVNALFKWVYLHNKRRGDGRNADIDEYFGEYFSRPCHHSIWKSFGEEHRYIRDHPTVSMPEFGDLKGAEQSLSSKSYVFVDDGDEHLGFLFEEGYSDLIAVEAKMSLKSLDYAGVLVAYTDGVERLVDVSDSSVSFSKPKPMMFLYERR